MSSRLKAWTPLGKALALQTRVFRVVAARWRSPRTDAEHTFSVVESADFVNVVALDTAGNLVMIRQFRFGTERFTLETPGGMADPGEDPRETAKRELLEESGYRAAKWTALGSSEPNPAIFDNRVHMFLAEGCERAGDQALDSGEDIEVVTMPVDEVMRALCSGQISHALAELALHRYRLYSAGLLDLP